MRVQTIILSICLLLFSRVALAHHDVSEADREHVQSQAYLGGESEAAGFNLTGVQGNYLTVAAKGSVLLTEQMALGIRVPFQILWLSGEPMRSGLGDLDLNLKYQLIGRAVPASPFLGPELSFGLGTELPTGNTQLGLGGGHVELTPFVSGLYSVGPMMLHGTFSALFAVLNTSQTESISWISPHTDAELHYHLGAMLPVSPELYANLIIGGYTSLVADPDLGGTGLFVEPSVGFTPGNWRITLGPKFPLGFNRRFDWKAAVSVDFVF